MNPLDLTNFPKTSKAEWITLATNQLKGGSPEQQLKWETNDLALGPYYDESDLKEITYVSEFFSDVSFPWKLYERIQVKADKDSNQQALDALQGGCDGIIFEIAKPPSFEILLDGILLDICDVSFIGQGVNISESNLPDGLSGFIHSSGINNTYHAVPDLSPIESIVQMLKNLHSQQHIIRYASTDFFLEIASIRALRYLIHEQLEKDAFMLQVHTFIPQHEDAEHQWFLNSTAGLASILGGTNSVSFTTATGNSRISRNTGNLIRDESQIDKYTDQCNGSYFIEVLTHQLIEACKAQLG